MKKTLLSLSIAAVAAVGITSTAQACSSWTADTSHGVTVARTIDWDTQLDAIAQVTTRGTDVVSKPIENYKNLAKWTAKYQTMSILEFQVFGGTANSAINVDSGLSVQGQYMGDSQPFLKHHKDTGAPAVYLGDVATYIASNFATVDEVKRALERDEFQIAWNGLLVGGETGAHFGVQDKLGNKMMIQLGEGGKQIIYYNDEDLVAMTNEPLLPEHRNYVSQVDLNDMHTIDKIPANGNSLNRTARILFNSQQSHLKSPDLTWSQVEGKVWGLFDKAAVSSQDVRDPADGNAYATWVSYVYNFDNGSFKLRNHATYNSIRFNLKDVAALESGACADLMAQANEGEGVKWQSCQQVLPAL